MAAEHHFVLALQFLESVQRGLALNLSGVDGYPGEVEAGKIRNVHGIWLGGIKPPPHRRKSPGQRPMDRGFCCSAECLRRVRIRQTHKVPANATNFRVQFCCHGPSCLGPSLGKRLPTQSELTRQDTSIPQEYGVYFHCCRLPGGLSKLLRPKSDAIGIGAEDAVDEEGPTAGVPAEARILFLLTVDLIQVAPS